MRDPNLQQPSPEAPGGAVPSRPAPPEATGPAAPALPESRPAGAPQKPGFPSVVALGIVGVGFVCAALIFVFLARVMTARRAEKARSAVAVPVPPPETVIEEVPVVEEKKVENLAAVTQARNEMPELTLGGILYSETEKSAALINGNVIPEGGKVKGVTLVRVLPDKVELEFEGRRIFMRSL
ncbi:MAG: general secretion pathway protein GspB [Deltaproteobacteria bacterium]